VSYPYIESTSKIAGGSPIIKGTRITVRTIAGYYQMGMSVDEILTSLSHLTSSQVHSALAYYFDHQEEADKDIAESSNEEYWKKQVQIHPKPGIRKINTFRIDGNIME
ncbi:MAG TPA: DUF433 domain-containing protein, partial [Candidatus Brocadiaceae bacterium]|nr:DUF433 domain-containing protein [Candidatus Brocadiaceae bacterium]